ncbi:MAG: ribbon-helix-helix domain-containing protein [Patescibacteria group bacterium]
MQCLHTQTQTLNISLPKDLVKRVDEVAKKEYRNRSELIREDVRRYLEDQKEWDQIFKAGEKAMQKMGIKSLDLGSFRGIKIVTASQLLEVSS